MIGTILGNRYEILEEVGSGGMAIVYKAKCRLLNRFVAIKMLREELKSDKEFVERFRVEAQSAASLNHHNIVSVYDVGQENDLDYFVMEYIDGVTLKEIIRTKKIDWRTACEYTIGICDAIEHAHKKNIVHRDIKPHNIMITKDNVVKVTDFGIARAVSSSTIVRAGNVIGSVHYFSPEQACGGIVDFKSDIYSIGVVLYEMLTGRVPFDAENPVAIAKMHVDNSPIPPSDILSEIPVGLSDIVLKAMAKQPVMRYQTVSALAQDLKKVMSAPDSVRVKDQGATQFIPVVEVANIPENMGYDNNEIKNLPENKKKSSNTSTVVAWIIAAVVLVASILTVVAVFNPGIFNFSKSTSVVPELVNMKFTEAEKMYENAGFIFQEKTEPSDKFEEGIIMEQEPKSGTTYKNGDTIMVTVSKGRDSIVLDDYSGKDIEKVRGELISKGVTNINIEYDSHVTYPKNTVFKQSPGKGSIIKPSDTVSLYVSTGKEEPKKVKVPDLVGLSSEIATATLKSVGLKEGEIKKAVSEEEVGLVIAQVIDKDTQVDPGTAISFTVSVGKPTPKPIVTKPTEEPTSTPAPTNDTGHSNTRDAEPKTSPVAKKTPTPTQTAKTSD